MTIRVHAAPGVCPVCRSEIAWRQVRFGLSFTCPSCRTPLRIRSALIRIISVTGCAIAFLGSYAIGLRGWSLLFTGFLGVIPLQTVMLLLTVRLFSVEFEPTGEVREILYPIEIDQADAVLPSTVGSDKAPIGVRLWHLFKGINEPRSLEGYAVQTGILVMALFVSWMCALPLLRSLFPGFDTNRSGPKGFPVTAHIGQSALRFTNSSDALWTCRAELGREPLSGTFDVGAGRTIEIRFATFDSNGALDDARIRKAAQDRIRLVCTEPSGISHSADLR
jgi:hypothetical protein